MHMSISECKYLNKAYLSPLSPAGAHSASFLSLPPVAKKEPVGAHVPTHRARVWKEPDSVIFKLKLPPSLTTFHRAQVLSLDADSSRSPCFENSRSVTFKLWKRNSPRFFQDSADLQIKVLVISHRTPKINQAVTKQSTNMVYHKMIEANWGLLAWDPLAMRGSTGEVAIAHIS